jgi:uncharacterized protein (DUF2147 family)
MRTILLAAVALVAAGGAALAADPTGDWLVADKTAVIRIAPCGAHLCGQVVWMKEAGTKDVNNSDPAKRTRSILGMSMLTNFKQSGPNRWDGETYNPKNGKIYSTNISLEGANVLRLQGCVLGILCGGETWSRAKCEPSRDATAARSPGLACRAVMAPALPSVARSAG